MKIKEGKLLGALVLILAGVTTLNGCSTAGNVTGGSDYTDNSYIVVNDRGFNSQVEIIDSGLRQKGDMNEAYVTLKSRRNRSLWIRYKFSWYDADGVEIDPGTKPYRDVVIEGRDEVSATSMAPNPQAKEFKFRVAKIRALKIQNIR